MVHSEDNPDFLNDFLDYSATILNKSSNSIKEYNYDIAHFLKFIKYKFGMAKIQEEKDVKTIIIKDMKITTVKRIKLEDIHAFLAYLKSNYRSKLDIRLPKYLTLEDSKKLLDMAEKSVPTARSHDNSERNFAMITLFLNCGMRLSELVNIDIKDIDFYDNKLNVIGKGNKERTIYLNNACVNALKRYLTVRPKDSVKDNSRDALFLSEQKKRISNRTVQHVVKEELRYAGLDPKKYSVHKLRHTAATLMYQYGQVDIRALQVLLGHESIATTEIYTHVSNEQVRNAVENNPLANRR